MQDNGTELPLYISILLHRLGSNVDVSATSGTDDPVVITENGDKEEEL